MPSCRTQAVADRLGLHGSDLRCLSIGRQLERLTPGEPSDPTDLSTGAVTRMLDRLERAGYVIREHDNVDRRRVVGQPHYRAEAVFAFEVSLRV